MNDGQLSADVANTRVMLPLQHHHVSSHSILVTVISVTSATVNILADHVSAGQMSAKHISELRRDLVPDPDIALLAKLSAAAGASLRYV